MQGEIKTLQRRIRYIRGEQPRAQEIDIDKMVEEKKEQEENGR